MKNVFSAEAIGLTPKQERDAERFGRVARARREALPQVAELTGRHRVDGYERRYLKAKADYTHANGRGNRGVWLYWTLECGPVYEARYRTDFDTWRRRLLVVEADGTLRDVTEEEVQGWLANVASA